MDAARLRAWWAHRQGLDGSLKGASAAQVLERTGWARSVAGVSPYLALFSRAGIDREAADAAVKKAEIHELPTARGCTYVLPASDYAIGLCVGQSFGEAEVKVAAKLGVTEKEIETLCAAVVKALAKGLLDPDGIRAATGSASRSLGEEGKKKGLSTTLPVALGRLQGRGEIRRVPTNGRLDNQRYLYTLWKPNPLSKFKGDETDALSEMARRFFRWVGPATAAAFQEYAGIGVKRTKEILEPLGLVPMEAGSEGLLLPDDVAAFKAFKVPAKPQYSLVGVIDPMLTRRGELAPLVDAADTKRKVALEKGLGNLNSFGELPSNAILDRGRVIGLWEFDAESREMVYTLFVKKDAGLEKAIRGTEEYVRDDLGDARSFSLDSPKSRAPKVALMRKMM